MNHDNSNRERVIGVEWHFAGALLAILVSFASTAVAGSPDERFVAGLRERRLFDLAEKFCRNELARPDVEPRRRVELTIELVRTYAEAAVASPPNERAPFWEKAHRAAEDFEQEYPGNPRLVLVELQDALVWLDQAELARQESEVVADREPLVEAARKDLRRAIDGLAKSAETIELRLRQQRRPLDGDALSTVQLQSLQRNVAYQLARAYRNQALAYPPGSPDFVNSLTQALEKLDAVAEIEVADDVIWRAKLDRAVCLRFLGKLSAASGALAEVLESGRDDAPAAIVARGRGEELRLLLAAGQLREAIEAAEKRSGGAADTGEIRNHHPAAGDYDLARVEVYLAAWQAANKTGRTEESQGWQRKAVALVAAIERDHGPYWMRRAEMLLASTIGGAGEGDVAALRRAAESFYRGGQPAEAVAAFDRTYGQATKLGDAAAAFDAAMSAAAIEQERKNYDVAARRFRQLAATMPKHARAAEAHLLAIHAAADRVRTTSGAGQGGALDEYAAILGEHLKLWPQGKTADQARWWLGNLYKSQRKWPEAIGEFRRVSPESDSFDPAVRAVAECYDARLAELSREGKQTDALADEAARFFEDLVLGPARQWPQTWTPTARFAAVSAARMRLRGPAQGYAHAERMLSAALAAADDAPGEWQSEARSLLVFSLAAQGRRREASAAMDQISGGSLGGLLSMLEALARLTKQAGPEVRGELAGLALRAVALVESRKAELKGDNLRLFETARAEALAAAGKRAEAMAAYEELVQKYPRDGDVQEAQAALLAAANDAETLRRALVQWQEVERKSRRGSERWYRARYATAEIYYRLGENDKARKLIELTRVLQPDMGGAEMKRKFDALFGQLK